MHARDVSGNRGVFSCSSRRHKLSEIPTLGALLNPAAALACTLPAQTLAAARESHECSLNLVARDAHIL